MKYLKRYNESLNESLNESEIHAICKKYNIKNYTINDDGSIDVDDNVHLSVFDLTKLPLNFRNVSGDFWCSESELTSLEGAPVSIGGNFSCRDNKITSLEGAPVSVGASFNCSDNKITSLKGAPESIGGDFWCNNNKIISLDGLEFKSFKNINISGNPINKIVNKFIYINDTKRRDELIEYFVDMNIIQGNKIIEERLFTFYSEMDIFDYGDEYEIVKM